MKEKRILNALEQVDEKYIEDAAPAKQKHKKPIWVRWVAAAACLCLVLSGLFVMTRPGNTPIGISGDLPQIAIPKYESGGMGFEGLMYYSAEELENGNPWREDMELSTLPVSGTEASIHLVPACHSA